MKAFRYHILPALAEVPLHGAEIRRRAKEQGGGAVAFYPATLYGKLDESASSGWIDEVDSDEAQSDQTRWRIYGLTREG